MRNDFLDLLEVELGLLEVEPRAHHHKEVLRVVVLTHFLDVSVQGWL
jgi:hypothetical protein